MQIVIEGSDDRIGSDEQGIGEGGGYRCRAKPHQAVAPYRECRVVGSIHVECEPDVEATRSSVVDVRAECAACATHAVRRPCRDRELVVGHCPRCRGEWE